ncbi:unnamed protein product [Meloidogyne enterolobii]|uniref:Uncharacterized protein n=1 Tax=Meloidogyne enterolobii TaxID=390850 RepID=A0ACB1AZ69_MELEN
MKAIEKFFKGEIDEALLGRFNEELREEGRGGRGREGGREGEERRGGGGERKRGREERGYIQSYEYIIT